MVTEIGPGWTIDDLRPYSELIPRALGPDRIIGSDWPVVNLASDDRSWVETVVELIDGQPPVGRASIQHQTATRLYNL